MQFSADTAAALVDTRDLTTAELAREWKKSEETIQGYARDGLIPGAYKVGRDWRFPRDARYTPKRSGATASAPEAAASTRGLVMQRLRALQP